VKPTPKRISIAQDKKQTRAGLLLLLLLLPAKC